MHPPYGEIPAIGGDGAIRVHTTSGTTGTGPLRALDSRKDWAWIAEMWCYALWGCGVRPGDTAYIAFGYGSFIGFWGLHYAMEKIGVLNVPGGAQTTETRVRQIVDFGATVVASTPTYALRLAQEAADPGASTCAGSAVERLILSGEPAGSIPQTKALIEEQWGAKAYDTAGHDRDRHDHGVRVRAPAGRHAHHRGPRDRGGASTPTRSSRSAYGERGERVVTSFGRGAIPLIRYRTGDLVCKVPASRVHVRPRL